MIKQESSIYNSLNEELTDNLDRIFDFIDFSSKPMKSPCPNKQFYSEIDEEIIITE